MPYSAPGCSLYGPRYWYLVPQEGVGVGELGVPEGEGGEGGRLSFDCPERAKEGRFVSRRFESSTTPNATACHRGVAKRHILYKVYLQCIISFLSSSFLDIPRWNQHLQK